MNEEEEIRINGYLQEHVSSVGKKIYGLIAELPLTKTDLRKRTNLPVKQLDDELNCLAGYNLIKAVKKPEKKNLNVWVLYHEKDEEEQQEQRNKNEDLISLVLKKDSSVVQIKKEAIRKAYSLEKLEEILEMLKMRGQIEIRQGEVRIRQMNKIAMPCISCELRRMCSVGSTISPETCPYLINW